MRNRMPNSGARGFAEQFGDVFANAAGQVDEAGVLVAKAVGAGKIPLGLAKRYTEVVREDLPAGRDLIATMLAG